MFGVKGDLLEQEPFIQDMQYAAFEFPNFSGIFWSFEIAVF